NVLIYFDAEARDRVIARLWNSLQPGGYLFVGYSESLRDHQARFFALRSEDGVIYRRREPNQPDPDAPSANAAPTARPMVAPHPLPIALPPSPAAPPVAAPSRAPAPPRLALSGDYTDGARLAAELRPLLAGEGAVVDLDGAGFLGDEAARVLERATRAAPGLVLTARRPAVRRWLWRHRLAPSEDE
ncbi:MAG TPA: CheR family methyltransferase, partial [Polyangia bacterium]